MKRTSYISFIAAAALAVCGCQNGLVPDPAFKAISFNPFIDGVTDTEMTKASAFRSEDGSVEIPAMLEVSDGIVSMPASDSATPLTKGTQINTTGSSTALATFASQIGGKFYVTGWKGSPAARFVGNDYATVAYSDGAWSTISTDWDGSASASFFAYANLPTSGAAVTNPNSSYQLLTYTAVPTTASAQTDILLGYYSGTGSPDSGTKTCTAALQFHHPLTAVRFKKGEFVGTVSFKAIYLDGVYKNGTALLIASGNTSTIAWNTTDSTNQEVGQEGDTYLTVADDVIGEPFLLIPQNLAYNPVTVTLVAEIDGTVHPLTATLDPVDWQAGKTYTYTLGYANYELTVDGEVSTDYKGSGANTYTVNSSADWKLQYTLDGGTNWSDAAANTQIGGWIRFDKVSGSGSSSAQTVTATVTAGSATTIANNHAAVLQSNPAKGTADAPYDLSMHTIYGEERTAGPVTANSYVINAPGWYAFPLVYGNAIDYNKVPSNGVNTQAFAPTGSGTNFLTPFKSSTGNITSPYIADVTAYPYWEDVPGYGLIAQNGCSVLSQNAAADKGLTGCNCGYVVFQVSKSSLQQGNAVIVVKDAGGNILWSWHIWVTDSDLTCRTVTNTGGTFSKGVMPLNLGWVDLGTSTGYERKNLQIRFVQIANGVVKNEVAKNPERREYVTENPAGQSPTYQWGRKDPFIRFKDDASELTTSEYSGTGLSFDGGAGAATPISSTIKNPTQFFYKDAWRQGDGKYINLWSATLTSTTAGGEGYTSAPVKTVYDPCPPGFQVPQMNAFDRWDYSGSGGEWNYGYKLKTSASGNDSIFFPATGFRNGESIYATAVWYKEYYSSPKSRYWTAAPNDGTGNRFYAYQLLIDKDAMGINYAEYKSSGLSIRPVQETSGKF